MSKHRVPRANVTKRILEMAGELGWSTYQLSERTDISKGVFESWKKGEHDMTISTLEVVAGAFGTKAHKILQESEEDDTEEEDLRLKRMMALFCSFGEEEKTCAVTYMEFLESERKKRQRS